MARRIARRHLLRLASPTLGPLLLLSPAVSARIARGHPAAQSGAVELAVETPAANATVSGSVQITGWAVDRTAAEGTGIQAVLVYVGGDSRSGTLLGEAQYGLDRPDIAARFGDPRFGRSGFTLTWDTVRLPTGPTTLVVYARTPAADWAAVTVPVSVERPAPPPATPVAGPPPAAAPAAPRAVDTAAGLTVEVVELTSPAQRGGDARLTVRTAPSAACAILVSSPNGPVGWPGLEPHDADASGQAQWTFRVPAAAPPGQWTVAVVAQLGQQIATARAQFSVA